MARHALTPGLTASILPANRATRPASAAAGPAASKFAGSSQARNAASSAGHSRLDASSYHAVSRLRPLYNDRLPEDALDR